MSTYKSLNNTKMLLILFFILLSFPSLSALTSKEIWVNKNYTFTNEMIDVVIPTIEKDLHILDKCIDGIRKNGQNIRRVIVVSPRKFTDKAEWFDEKNFPFTKEDILTEILADKKEAKKLLDNGFRRTGWILQQLIKFYAPFVIPDISSNVLILDSDTLFLKPVAFLNKHSAGLYTPAGEWHPPYFHHAARLLPGFQKKRSPHSGVAHHMLFQKAVLEDLFTLIEKHHGVEPWRAICRCIDVKEIGASCMSEYEIYYHFVFNKSRQVSERKLKWSNACIEEISSYKAKGFDYVSCHTSE